MADFCGNTNRDLAKLHHMFIIGGYTAMVVISCFFEFQGETDMKKAWKWILGIVLGLIVLTALVGIGLLMRNNFHDLRAEPFERGFPGRTPWMMPFGGFDPHLRGPGLVRYGLNHLGGFIGRLFSLGFLAIVVLGIIWLVKSLSTPKHVAESAPMPAAVTNPCKKCGRPLQDDWKNCPYCGKKV